MLSGTHLELLARMKAGRRSGSRRCLWLGLVSVALMRPAPTPAADPPKPAASEAVRNEDRIRPYAANPWYWQYQGRPVLLLGGSKDDNPFQLPDLEAHLDEVAAAGGNYLRNTMSDRPDQGFEVYPFLRLADGRYDLSRWNPEYWERFARFLRWTRERDIIVQIEIWDRFDFSRQNWDKHPYNPANNINYTAQDSGLATRYPNHPGANEQPFFFTTPAQRDNRVVFPFQRRFVDELLRHALPSPNVLYCIDNETSGDEAWAKFWAGHLHDQARAAGVDIFITEMWDDWNLKGAQHRRTFDHPDRYAFVDVSQNNHQKGQTHWDNFQWARELLSRHPRPMNTVKTYGADGGRFGNDRDGLERWWRHLLGGAAAVRFHRPDSGLGLSPKAVASLRAARRLGSVVSLWDLRPANDRLRDREPNEAYAAAGPAGPFAFFLPDGGSVGFDLGTEAPSVVRWINVTTGDWGPTHERSGSRIATLTAPGPGPWAAAVLPR